MSQTYSTNYNVLATPTALYTLFYFIVSICFVLRTREFVFAGLTVENLFDFFLKNEDIDFIGYHAKRTVITLCLHSLLPLGYLGGAALFADKNLLYQDNIWFTAFFLFSIVFPSLTFTTAYYWTVNEFNNHPIVKTLKQFCDNRTSWKAIAAHIAREYRRVDKINLQTSTVCRVVVTDNWIIKISPYSLDIAHQRDSVLVLCTTDTHVLSHEGNGSVQYVNIEVKSTRPGINSFFIRCNALDFNNIQNRVQIPISIIEGIKFHKTKIEHFLDVFKETVEKNPPYSPPPQQELENCIGCMVAQPSVKLVKCCKTPEPCTNCYCRPLWCLDCMGKWFATRQEQDHPETWLSSVCTCPVCRSIFCVLDVCPIKLQHENQSET
ncbi:E3 ubiquitin-protein ligase TM129 [Cimex lectularius]|uniref:E3 ubiquitin-protein ligase TM129 n=1 Tax=Cimex lectularius TaxID=79782 RepID=A0A8I6S3H1_CIMLE|nr:E3 ubiquitin-protein ligase TM129 [Cimex lectularius]